MKLEMQLCNHAEYLLHEWRKKLREGEGIDKGGLDIKERKSYTYLLSSLFKMSCNVMIIGRAKRAPHCAIQSRFCMIYVYIYIYVCRFVYDILWETHTKKWYAKMHGWNYVFQTGTCSKSVLGV